MIISHIFAPLRKDRLMNWISWSVWTLVFCILSFPAFSSETYPVEALSEGQDTLKINFSGGVFQRGDTICVDMTVEGFNFINSLQFSISWDATVLEFIELRDVNPGNEVFQLIPQIFGAVDADKGLMRFAYYDPNIDGESAPDGFRMARLCFRVTGNPGDKTSLSLSNFPLAIEAQDTNDVELCMPIIKNPICVGFPNDLFSSATACSTTGSSGEISLKAWGDQTPFTVDIPALAVVGDLINNAGECIVYDNLSPGNYTITVRDAMGNDTTFSIEVFNRERISIDTLDLRLPRCFNESNGLIRIGIQGGVPSYNILWDPVGAANQTIIRRVPVGVYSVTVKDSLGCIASDTFDLASDLLTADLVIIDSASCVGKDDGVVEVTPTGGNAYPGGQYQFYWSMNDNANGRGTIGRNDRLSGPGFVVVEDASGCRDTLFFDIPSKFELQVDITTDSVLCFEECNGKVQIVANTSGMQATPYFFVVSRLFGGPVTGGSVLLDTYMHDSICAGRYVLDLRDGEFCTLKDTFEIMQPDPLEVIIVNGDTSSGCGTMSDAFLEVDGFGGIGGPYTYRWDYNNATTPRIDNLPEDTYTVTVFDGNMCEAERTFTISGSTGPEITGFDITPVGCPGDTSGRITVLYTEGDTTIASITWDNGDSGAEITGLMDGQYIVTIIDNNGCRAVDTATIDPPNGGLMITSFIIDTPSCNGLIDGFLQINVDGGVGPYTFQWSNNSRDSILTQIGAGRYIVAIRDQTNCPPVIDSFDIPEPPSIDIDLLSTDMVSCNNDTTCDGRAIATASGGPDPSRGYIFTWASGEVGFGAPDTAINLCRGTQLLIVSNVDCSDSLEIEIDAPPTLTVDFDQSNVIRPSCFGDMDGSITLTPNGGTGVKRVIWDLNMFVGNTLNNLSAGTYAFFVEDANGCLYRDSVDVKNPDPLMASILDAASSDISCPDGDDGRITVIWRGGNRGPATFDWTPTNNTDSVGIELDAGDYEIIVTDSKGCMDTVQRSITEPAPIVADFPTSDSVLCFGEQLAITVIGANGGNGPDFTYSVNNGARRNLGDEINLFAGMYQVRVFDKDGCAIDTTINIFQPNPFDVDLGPSPVELELGDSLTICYQTNINGRVIDSIVWVGPGRPTDPSLRCYTIKPTSNTTYQIEVFDQFGCSATDELEVIVLNQGKVFVPNVLMPEGNVNTVLGVYTGLGVASVDKMEIYDRWGELIFRQENLESGDGWNGRMNNTGELMMTDVYVYVVNITYKDGTEEIRRGSVTLVR